MTNIGVYFPLKNPSTRFIVKNIAPGNKRIRIFQYPILNGETRDLLSIPGISEADLRHSLLKGQLLQKLRSKEIIVVDSDIDLLQFNDDQKLFLQQSGITKGLEVTAFGGGGMTEAQHKTLRQLIHLVDVGPMDGFTSGAFREILPADDPFPTQIIWWESSPQLKKIVEKDLSYDASKRIVTTIFSVYDTEGILLAKVTDTISYNGSSPFESTRVRTVA